MVSEMASFWTERLLWETDDNFAISFGRNKSEGLLDFAVKVQIATVVVSSLPFAVREQFPHRNLKGHLNFTITTFQSLPLQT